MEFKLLKSLWQFVWRRILCVDCVLHKSYRYFHETKSWDKRDPELVCKWARKSGQETDITSCAKTGVILPYVNNKTSSQLRIRKEARKFSLKWITCVKQWLQQQAKTMQRVLNWHLFNNYSWSPNGLWLNHPRGRRLNGLFMAIGSWAMRARGILMVKSN